MAIIKAREWANKYFGEGSRPSRSTLNRWAKAKIIEGSCIGGALYVEDKPPSAMQKPQPILPPIYVIEDANPLILGKFKIKEILPG